MAPPDKTIALVFLLWPKISETWTKGKVVKVHFDTKKEVFIHFFIYSSVVRAVVSTVKREEEEEQEEEEQEEDG